MNIHLALFAIKNGEKVKRSSGSQTLYLMTASAASLDVHTKNWTISKFVCVTGVFGPNVPYAFSDEELAAEDWEIVE